MGPGPRPRLPVRDVAEDALGGVPFPAIGELPYLLTLNGYGFYWFRLAAPEDGGAR